MIHSFKSFFVEFYDAAEAHKKSLITAWNVDENYFSGKLSVESVKHFPLVWKRDVYDGRINGKREIDAGCTIKSFAFLEFNSHWNPVLMMPGWV